MDTDKPIIVHYDGLTKTQTEHEMTEEEYADFLASGWTRETQDNE